MKKCVLGDIADLSLGKMLDAVKNRGQPREYLSNIDVRWGSFDLDHLKQMRFEDCELEKFGLRLGDIVMCEGGEPGRCAIWKNERPGMMIQKALHRIRPHDSVCGEYLYYFFLNIGRSKGLAGLFKGATIKHLTKDVLKNLEMELPEKKVQQKIAAGLSALDRKIALNRRKIATLEKMAKEIYDCWFVQYDFPDANGRPYKSSGGEMVYSPELKREIPKGWKVDALSSFCEVVNGATPSTSTIGNYGGDIVWITPKDLSDQGQKFIACGERCITKLGYESCSTHMIPKGSLLMSSRAPIGLLAMAACELCTNQGFKNLVPNDMSDRFYLYYYLQSHMSQIEQLGSGTTFKEVSREAISKYPILYVTDQMVRKRWVDFISPIFGRQMVMQDEADRLIALRDFLLPLLMNGQARIGDAAE